MSDRSAKRPYEAPVRVAAAQETRRKIRTAASNLFVCHGYTGTSMKVVAAEAEVSERTVYVAFPSKAALLSECIRVAVRGDDEATPMLARAQWRAILEAPPERMLSLLADASVEVLGRTARLLAVGESVGPEDPLLNEVRERGRAATRSDLLEVARAMKRAGALKRGMSAERAADVMYALAGSESVYLRLVEHSGWSPSACARALEHALAGAVGA